MISYVKAQGPSDSNPNCPFEFLITKQSWNSVDAGETMQAPARLQEASWVSLPDHHLHLPAEKLDAVP